MKRTLAVLLCFLPLACNRTSELRGVYVSQDSAAIVFPCDDPNAAILVNDSALATRSRGIAHAPDDGVLVRLEGMHRRSGSIYSGRRYFVVTKILELRSRATGECPRVAHPVTSILLS